MSDLFQPQSRPSGERRTRPGYLPPEPDFFPEQLDQLFSPPVADPPELDYPPQQPGTIPRQRGSAPPRQPPLITPLNQPASPPPLITEPSPPTSPPPPHRRRKRRSGWWLAIIGLVVALGVAAGVLIAMDKIHLGSTSSSSASTSATPVGYRAVTAREWLLIAKDPDAHKGERIIVYGQVKQLDAETGTNGFRASVDGVTHPVQSGSVDYATNTVLTWRASDLHNVAQVDLFVAHVTVTGSTTQNGVKTPLLAVDTIEVVGTAK
ncbi:MAG: hypothetical protein JWR88_1469 [Pseudonocardia sp.]|nr:hypothetical protein [Pseudonocardia sp.]